MADRNFPFIEVLYSDHAVLRMFERRVAEKEVEAALNYGEIIESYPSDTPHPSFLIFKKTNGRPLHIVVGWNASKARITVITLYEPDLRKFEIDLKTRRKP